MEKNNLLEMVKNSIETKNELEKTMLDILINNLVDCDSLEDIKNYMENDAICVNGSVSRLIYYSETHAIFKEFYEEIFNLYNDLKEEYGELNIELNANNLVWLTFEELTRKWYYSYIEDLEIEEE